MNLQSIQKRIEELTSELMTVSNDLAFLLQGEVSRPAVPAIPAAPDPYSAWARDIKAGDKVVCVGFNTTNETRLRCFTIGKEYIVDRHLFGERGARNYGLRILRDNDDEGHDATGVLFAKVG